MTTQLQHNLPRVAVVILNWNTRVFLQKFLPPLLETPYKNLEIIVADNASTDDSVDYLKEHFEQVRIIPLKENLGFAGGYNTALAEVEADYFVLLNSDVQVSDDWVTPVIKVLEADENIAAAQPKIRALEKPQYFEYAGACGGHVDVFGYPFCRGRIFDVLEKDEGQYQSVEEIFWASGACFFIRPQLFFKYKGFDEDFFAHMEEIDLCWRLRNAGYSLKVVPQAVVYHLGGGSLPKDNPRKVFYNFRNSLVMLEKNLPTGQLFVKIFVRMVLDGVAALKELATGNIGFFKAIFYAHMSFYFHQRKWINKRREIEKRMKLQHIKGVYHGSVVWEFFIKGKKKFTELDKDKFAR